MARRRGLSSSSKSHASKVESAIGSVESHTQLSRHGTCGLRLVSLEAAIYNFGKVRAHATESGGRVEEGALTPKTVSTATMQRVYAAEKAIRESVRAFKSECVRGGTGELSGKRRR